MHVHAYLLLFQDFNGGINLSFGLGFPPFGVVSTQTHEHITQVSFFIYSKCSMLIILVVLEVHYIMVFMK